MLVAMNAKLVTLSLTLALVPLVGCGPPEADVDSGAEAKAKADAAAKAKADAAAKAKPKSIPIIGTYELDVAALKRRFVDAIDGEMNSLAKAMYEDLDRSSGTIVIKEESQFRMSLGGSEVGPLEGTWTLEDDNLKMMAGENEHVAKLANGVITMVVNDSSTGTRTFVRVPDKPQDEDKVKK